MSYRGKFSPLHPQKYMGNPVDIVFRSRWELIFMQRLDASNSVVAWSSEELIIKYPDPFRFGHYRRYFVDFVVKVKSNDGTIKTQLVEIKPYHETQPPKKAAKNKAGQITKPMKTFIVNQAKWKAAAAYCAKRENHEFKVITEKHMPSFVGKA